MLSSSDENLLNGRLRNWGRWAADNPHVGSTSPLWRAMKLYGKEEEGNPLKAPEEQQTPEPVDAIDAAIVHRAWQGLPESPRRYHIAKWVLAYYYCYPHMPNRIACKKLKIGKEEFDQLMRLAKYCIFKRIEAHAKQRMIANETYFFS